MFTRDTLNVPKLHRMCTANCIAGVPQTDVYRMCPGKLHRVCTRNTLNFIINKTWTCVSISIGHEHGTHAPNGSKAHGGLITSRVQFFPSAPQSGFRAIPKLTRWHCGTNPSTFERIRQYIKADEDEKDELSAEELIAAAGGSPGMPLFAPKLTYLYRKPRLSTYEKSVNSKGLSPLPVEPQVCLFLPQS